MRSITFSYPDLASLAQDLKSEDPEVPLPEDQVGAAGEWALAVFKVDGSSTSSASAGRIEARDTGLVLVFEARDWKRLSTEMLGTVSSGRGPKSVRSKRPVSSSTKNGPRSKRKPGAGASASSPASVRGASSGSKGEGPRSSRGRTLSAPPPSQRTVLTRTLVPPPTPEIHEADAPDKTLEAPVDPSSFARPSRGGGARATGSRPASSSSRPPPPRLLLVDDDPDLQVMIREMLDAIGLEVDCVSDGEVALDRLVLDRFDLVVLDWELPGMSGLELCREIRRHPKLGATPILFLTGKSGSRDLVDAFAAGADDFVAKPFRAPELGARLLALLRRAKIGLSLPPPAE